MINKFIWFVLLWIDIGLFTLSVISTHYWLNIVVILLSLVIYTKGDSALFSLYNKKISDKRKQEKQIKEATQMIVSSGRLFKGGRQK